MLIVLQDHRTLGKDHEVDQLQEATTKMVLQEHLSRENAPQVLNQHQEDLIKGSLRNPNSRKKLMGKIKAKDKSDNLR